MFNSKPIWWTLMISWMLGACYWHICRIKQLCDSIAPANLSYPNMASARVFNLAGRIEIAQFEIDIEPLAQYAVILTVTMLLAFCTGNSYKDKKHQELHYKLNRVNKELEYYRSKQ